MRCAIDCILYLYTIWNKDGKTIVSMLESKIEKRGISMFEIVNALKSEGVQASAYTSWHLPKEENAILYLNRCKISHYLILQKKNFFYVWIYDGKLGNHKIMKWRLYLLYSHKYILCYNK